VVLCKLKIVEVVRGLAAPALNALIKLARRQLPDKPWRRLGPFTLPLSTTTGQLEVR